MPVKSSIVQRAKKIKLIAMDVDGVLNNGDVIVLESGEELKPFNVKDRLCLSMMRDRKVPLIFAWITGRSSEAVTTAADGLGIHHLVQKCHSKKEALETILMAHHYKWEDAAFIGDDLIDLPALKAVGLSICPSDAVSDVRKRVHYVSPLAGGRGVVRDVIELILKAQNRWDALLAPFLS